MSAENYLQILKDSLIKKKDILKKLTELNDEQENIINQPEFDETVFNKNVDHKAELIEKLIKLDEGFNSVFERVKEQLNGNRAAYASQIKNMQGLIREVTELAAQVETKEKRNRSLVESRFAAMRKEISNVRRNTQMANTYYKNMNKLNYEPQFMDKKK